VELALRLEQARAVRARTVWGNLKLVAVSRDKQRRSQCKHKHGEAGGARRLWNIDAELARLAVWSRCCAESARLPR
jgi:hypothetical protein